ncbi:MAG: phosphotransferase [Anaerolineales bacterium]
MPELRLGEGITWSWPFSRSDLLAGLRRTLKDTSLQIREVRPLKVEHRQPSIGRIRGLEVDYRGETVSGQIALVLKEPLGTTRTGLAGAGRREIGFYRSLASEVPMHTPSLVAASPTGDWLLLEFLHSKRQPAGWGAQDYLRSVDALAALHNRFWGLAVDLDAFPWLGDPITSDFAVHRAAADKAIERITKAAKPEPLAGFPGRRWILERLVDEADKVIQPLLDEPATLLHGDYWPGNIAIGEEGAQTVFDWQLAGIGPGIMDLLVFISKADWWFGPLPIEPQALVESYRQQLAGRGGIEWADSHWQLLWDHALMWRFIQEWLDLLAAVPLPVLATRAEQLDRVWLQPVEDALTRRLGKG